MPKPFPDLAFKPDMFSDFFKQHKAHLEALSNQLAINFDVPAQRLINMAFTLMGVYRFTNSGDDLWQMYIAYRDRTEYERPSKQLRQRWESY